MELYFKSDQNNAISLRHIGHTITYYKRLFNNIINDQIEIINLQNFSNFLENIYNEYSEQLDQIVLKINNLSVDGMAPNKEVIIKVLRDADNQFYELNSLTLQNILFTGENSINKIKQELSSSNAANKNNLIEKLDESTLEFRKFLLNAQSISLLTLYKESGNTRNEKLSEIENTKALSKWIQLLKLEPILKNYLQEKQDFLIHLLGTYVNLTSSYPRDEIKFMFLKDTLNKLFEDYYELLASQIRTNLVATEDRELIINQLQNIIHQAFEKKQEMIVQFFEDNFDELLD